MKRLFVLTTCLVFALVGCNNQNSTGSAGESTANDKKDVALTGAIAYVNIDSLVAKYDLAIELQTAYADKAQKLDGELTSKGRSLEKGIADYQDKVNKGLVTRSQAAELEAKLTNQQNALVQHRDQALQSLSEEEAVMNNRIFYGISDYIKEYNADGKYDMIISTSATGPIMDANPALDITAEILSGINAKYAAEKGDAKSTAKADTTSSVE